MPPAIHDTMTASAVAFGRPPCACSDRGSRPTSAESVAPAVAPRNARRPTSREKTVCSSAVKVVYSLAMKTPRTLHHGGHGGHGARILFLQGSQPRRPPCPQWWRFHRHLATSRDALSVNQLELGLHHHRPQQ